MFTRTYKNPHPLQLLPPSFPIQLVFPQTTPPELRMKRCLEACLGTPTLDASGGAISPLRTQKWYHNKQHGTPPLPFAFGINLFLPLRVPLGFVSFCFRNARPPRIQVPFTEAQPFCRAPSFGDVIIYGIMAKTWRTQSFITKLSMICVLEIPRQQKRPSLRCCWL